MSAKWTITQDGRHAVELEPAEGTDVIVHWRLIPPGHRSTFTVDVTCRHTGGNRYTVRVEVVVPTWSARVGKVRDQLRVAFVAYDESDARYVLKGLARAWACGRIPLSPSNRTAYSSWLLYLDATADAVMMRRAQSMKEAR